MGARKLGKLRGVNIARIVKPVGIRLRCEFSSPIEEIIELEISGDLALALAKEMEQLLPTSGKTASPRPARGKKKKAIASKRPAKS